MHSSQIIGSRVARVLAQMPASPTASQLFAGSEPMPTGWGLIPIASLRVVVQREGMSQPLPASVMALMTQLTRMPK